MKLLICTDGSEQAERAIKVGAAIAVGCEAEVTLLGIDEGGSKSDTIADSLNRGQSLLGDKKIAAEVVTKVGDPITEIVKRTEETNYDLVVIGAVRKGARGAFWMSSKSYKIMKEIQPPVLSVAGKSSALKRALICSGGKSFIDPAVELTARIAKGCGASVTLLHVMPEPPRIYAGLPRMDLNPDKLLKSRSELGLNLQHEKDTLESHGVPTQIRLRQGPVLDEILREMHEGGYDLIVTGSAPSRHFRTYVLGDISREIVNRLSCAVLVVRSHQHSLKPHVWKFWAA